MYISVIYLIKSILARNIFFVNKCRKIFFTFLHEKYRLFNIVVLIQQCHNGKHTSSKKNAMTPGIDYAAYPKSRSFVAGINVTF